MNLEELYKSFSTNKDSKELLLQSHWFASFADFDPKTGETLPMSLNKALNRIANRQPSKVLKDRLWLLTDHSEQAARRLMKALSEEPRRESAYLPIRDVRELDTASFIALSRRPGRNIREKLADKPYMQAVRHFQSIDVPENRLLKTYLMTLADALELRKKYLKDRQTEDLLQTIYRWLNEDGIREIARWENLAPNNTLLSHRDYRRVWNSWRWLQSIEEDIENDFANLQKRRDLRTKWDGLAKRYASGNTVYADMPLFVDFNAFDIVPWDETLPCIQAAGISHDKEFFETNEPVCLDLTQLHPVYATPSQEGKLTDSFFWQRWNNGDEAVDLELFDSDAVYAGEGSVTVTCSDMFFYRGKQIPEVLNQASRSFSLRLREHFRNGKLIWLTPDSMNDFELDLVRRNINSGFSQAEPLPCAVAAVVKHIDYSKISRDGYRVAVVERINGKAFLTEMVARYDADLRKELPETHGYIWEKGFSKLISSDVEVDSVNMGIYMLGRSGEWTRNCNPYGVAHKDDRDQILPRDGFDCAIRLNGRPVSGGIKLYQLQRQVKDIPLWRYRIPELMTKVMMNGFYQPFYFVGKDVTVQPVRGKAVRIPVPQEFTLPMGKKAYRLPLLQGANEEALEYEAKLVSKDFPYSEDVKCSLIMTYTYGADDPYKLVFEPTDKRYRKVNVIWQLKEDVVIDDAPAPGYPESEGWPGILRHYNPVRQEYSDLTEWALRSTRKLLDIVSPINASIVSGPVKIGWKRDKNGKQFTFVTNPNGKDYFIHENSLAHGVDSSKISEGDTLYFFTEKKGDKVVTKHVAPREEWSREDVAFNVSQNASKYIHSAMYVPFIRIWADGRSCIDSECPTLFRNEIGDVITRLYNLTMTSNVSDWLKRDVVFLMCCMGKDMPTIVNRYVISMANSKKLDEQSLGFALGNLSEGWQKELFKAVIAQNNGFTLRTFAHAIWRSEGFVHVFSYEELQEILDCLMAKVWKNTEELCADKDPNKRKRNVAHMTRYLELLMGLLRTRESSDESIRMLLQPGQDRTVKFSESVNLLIADAVSRGDDYFSRLKLDISTRASDDRTPDLLYALRVYLEGDMAASAIRVTGVAEDDE